MEKEKDNSEKILEMRKIMLDSIQADIESGKYNDILEEIFSSLNIIGVKLTKDVVNRFYDRLKKILFKNLSKVLIATMEELKTQTQYKDNEKIVEAFEKQKKIIYDVSVLEAI